ncbi:sensor histidine kinase [Taibaiella chishuiensis]|uniref:sensor histidine kinase n=1 Tax=Taibaiella chishuiensis TaxID=1434707 RepID=UPI0015E70FCF|nr:HAMP domain-containing sensor histidine kinase [Taibaiella chishuiensis]
MQIFWLYNAYGEQRKRLLATANEALLETQLMTGVNRQLTSAAMGLTNGLLEGYAKGERPVVKLNPDLKGELDIRKIKPGDISTNDEELKSELAQLIGMDTAPKNYTIQQYKLRLNKTLVSKHVSLPFELALLDPDCHIIASTVDTAKFLRTGTKSGMEQRIIARLNEKQSGILQLAFPNVAFYLLREMGLVLFLSLFFIVVCGFSFYYMIALFFKDKKEAEVKNDFMNNMTHELKTPISSVSMALELLQDESVVMKEADKKEYFQIAGNELKRLGMLVDKVLRMSAFEKMEVDLNLEKFEVLPWLEEIVSAVKLQTEGIASDITINIWPFDLQFNADKEQLTSVIQNLLDNAVKYRDQQKDSLNIWVDVWEHESNNFITITDNGQGIAAEYIYKVFGKFFRVPTGDEHDIKGYGLGLSYVREIIKLHHGEIEVSSTLKRGTKFEITIPKKQSLYANNSTGRGRTGTR